MASANLAGELTRLEARLAEQVRDAEVTRAQIREVQGQLQALAEADTKDALSCGPQSAAEKVALFRSLFRGREDVYPRLWVSARGDRKGYSPVCINEGDRTLCDKFRVKCSECPSRRLAPVEDRVVVDHLQGRHVMGVYTTRAGRPEGACPSAGRRPRTPDGSAARHVLSTLEPYAEPIARVRRQGRSSRCPFVIVVGSAFITRAHGDAREEQVSQRLRRGPGDGEL